MLQQAFKKLTLKSASMNEDKGNPPKSKAVEEAERISKIFEETQKRLQTDENLVNYLKPYDDKSVERFIKYYAQQKSNWFQSGNDLERFRKSMKTHYYNQALVMFREIYHKKLFNVMCRWVAGEFDLPGIELSADFYPMIYDPGLCTFVEPITSEEFDCYWQFRQTGNWLPSTYSVDENDSTIEDGYSSSQIAIEWYHKYRSIYMRFEKREIPPWFSFYDKHFGTAYLLDLPHLRTDIELQYVEIWDLEIQVKTLTLEQLKNRDYRTLAMRKLHFENPDIAKAYQDEHNRQYYERKKNEPDYVYISAYSRDVLDEVVPLIESREIIRYYEAVKVWDLQQQRGEDIEMDIIHLQEAKELIPIMANDDYRKAIKQAYEDYSKKKTMDCLPHIFDAYRQCIQKGESFDWLNGAVPEKKSNELRNKILDARKHRGEPENFDFLKKENLKFE
jgi:hypothetical protein